MPIKKEVEAEIPQEIWCGTVLAKNLWDKKATLNALDKSSIPKLHHRTCLLQAMEALFPKSLLSEQKADYYLHVLWGDNVVAKFALLGKLGEIGPLEQWMKRELKNVSDPQKYVDMALILAADNNQWDLTEWILQQQKIVPMEFPPLKFWESIAKKGNIDFLIHLDRNHMIVRLPDSYVNKMMAMATEHNQLAVIRWLVDHSKGNQYLIPTALRAAAKGRLSILQYILQQDPSFLVSLGWNLIDAAARNEQINILDWLLDQEGIDFHPNVWITADYSPEVIQFLSVKFPIIFEEWKNELLHLAIQHNNIDIAQWLIYYAGAQPDDQDLNIAIINANFPMLDLLLRVGADPAAIQDIDIKQAIVNDDRELVQNLVEGNENNENNEDENDEDQDDDNNDDDDDFDWP